MIMLKYDNIEMTRLEIGETIDIIIINNNPNNNNNSNIINKQLLNIYKSNLLMMELYVNRYDHILKPFINKELKEEIKFESNILINNTDTQFIHENAKEKEKIISPPPIINNNEMKYEIKNKINHETNNEIISFGNGKIDMKPIQNEINECRLQKLILYMY